MKAYLLRHGETDWNKARRFQGSSDIPLNESGRKAARLTAAGMKDIFFDKVYASPLLRAKETAQIICEGRDLEIVLDDRVREIDFGDFEGLSWRELKDDKRCENFRKVFTDPASYKPERGAESLSDVIIRAREFLEEEIYPLEKSEATVLVAAHGAVIRGIMSAGLGFCVADFWGGPQNYIGKPLPNCGAAVITVEDGKMKVLEEGVIFYDPDDLN